MTQIGQLETIYLASGHGCEPVKLCLWTLWCEFHVSQNSGIISNFQNYLKNVKTILSLQKPHKNGQLARCDQQNIVCQPPEASQNQPARTRKTKHKHPRKNKFNNISGKGS